VKKSSTLAEKHAMSLRDTLPLQAKLRMHARLASPLQASHWASRMAWHSKPYNSAGHGVARTQPTAALAGAWHACTDVTQLEPATPTAGFLHLAKRQALAKIICNVAAYSIAQWLTRGPLWGAGCNRFQETWCEVGTTCTHMKKVLPQFCKLTDCKK
jgi:hypothetical protein